jgi:hypothetical protein
MGTSTSLVESPQSQGTDMASLVVAGCDRDVINGTGTYEADLLIFRHLLAFICSCVEGL